MDTIRDILFSDEFDSFYRGLDIRIRGQYKAEIKSAERILERYKED